MEHTIYIWIWMKEFFKIYWMVLKLLNRDNFWLEDSLNKSRWIVFHVNKLLFYGQMTQGVFHTRLHCKFDFQGLDVNMYLHQDLAFHILSKQAKPLLLVSFFTFFIFKRLHFLKMEKIKSFKKPKRFFLPPDHWKGNSKLL